MLLLPRLHHLLHHLRLVKRMTHSHITFNHSEVPEGDIGIAPIVPLSLPVLKKTELLPTPQKTLAFHLSSPKKTIYCVIVNHLFIGQLLGILLIGCSLYRNTDQFDYSKFGTIYTSLPVHLINASSRYPKSLVIPLKDNHSQMSWLTYGFIYQFYNRLYDLLYYFILVKVFQEASIFHLV